MTAASFLLCLAACGQAPPTTDEVPRYRLDDPPRELRFDPQAIPLRSVEGKVDPQISPQAADPQAANSTAPASQDAVKDSSLDERSTDILPLAHVSGPERSRIAETLVRTVLTPPAGVELTGVRRTTLVELLAGKELLGPQHLEIVRAYWQLSSRLADYYFAASQHQRIASQAASPTGAGLTLALAVAKAEAMERQAQVRLVQAQHALAELMGNSANAPLPLPVDLPLAGEYRTHFAELFAAQSPGDPQRRARRLHEVLPLRVEAIEALAVCYERAESLRDAHVAAHRQEKTSEAALVTAFAEVQSAHAEFTQAVRDYNLDIAQYAMLAAPPEAPPSALLPMLLKSHARKAEPAAPDGPPLEAVRSMTRPGGRSTSLAPPADNPIVQAAAQEPISAPELSLPPEATASSVTKRLRSVLVRKRP